MKLGSRAWCGSPMSTDEQVLSEIVLRVGTGAPVIFSFEDSIRPAAKPTIAALRRQGIAVEMLSGDRAAAVERAARDSESTAVFSRMSPQAKLAHVEHLAIAGRKALIVGDGINDAPALAAGFVSMAPATASDIGRTAADVVFMGQSLAPVGWLRVVSVARPGDCPTEYRACARLQSAGGADRHAGLGHATDRRARHVVIKHSCHRQCLAPWLAGQGLAGQRRAESIRWTSNSAAVGDMQRAA